MSRPLAVVLTAAAALWATAILVVPFAAADRHAPYTAAAVRAMAALVCHQRPERSFQAGTAPFPVCARCTGLYLAGAAGALAAWLGPARAPRRTRALIAAAAIPTAATVLVEWAGIAFPSNFTRFASALPLGFAAGWLFVRLLRVESPRSTCAMMG